MKHKRDWADISGPVTLYQDGATHFGNNEQGRLVVLPNPVWHYSSIEEFCQKRPWVFVDDMGCTASPEDDDCPRWWRRNHWKLFDQNGMEFPISIIKRVYCEVIPKESGSWRSYRNHYNHENDFRDGPVNYTRCPRGGSGHRRPHYISQQKMNAQIDVDNLDNDVNIKVRKSLNFAPWDCYRWNGRFGNNWKRQRKTQWK